MAFLLQHPQFGTLQFVASRRSQRVTIRRRPSGVIRISTPRPPMSQPAAYKLVGDLTPELTTIAAQAPRLYTDRDMIAGHIMLIIQQRAVTNITTLVTSTSLRITIPQDMSPSAHAVQTIIRQKVLLVLRKEAKLLLPGRVQKLAQQFAPLGVQYQRLRLSHSATRWGSYSSRGTLSLNIALLFLPGASLQEHYSTIDYVIIHELAHSVHLNHSPAFWQLVSQMKPDYQADKTLLARHSPYL